MEFSYYNQKGGKVSRTLKVGQKWSEQKTSNSTLNSIFAKIDNGDGIISETELDTLYLVLDKHDTDDNNIYNNEELKTVYKYYSKQDYIEIKKSVKIGENIYNDTHAKRKFGLPTTGNDIAKHVKAITPNNVITVMTTYYNKDKEETIFDGILSEVGLPLEERFKYVKHIFSQLVTRQKQRGIMTDDIVKEFNAELNYQKSTWTPANSEKIDSLVNKLINRHSVRNKSQNVMPNGKIDKNFKQGRVGDCWLLASIKAISKTPNGLKILNESIKVDSKGNVTVTLKGVNKKYTFTKKEILGSTQLSTGDLDVRAIEMAVDKYFTEQRGVNGKIDIDGNYAHVAYRILTGKGGRNLLSNTYGRIPEHWFSDSQIDNFNKPNHVACVWATGKNSISYKTNKGKNVELVSSHAYTVSRSDSRYVYLINPWNTSSEIAVPRKIFKEFFNIIDEFDL